MSHYRLYFMSPLDGHIDRFFEFEADSDLEALRTVQAASGEEPLELWSGQRKIGRFEVDSAHIVQDQEAAE